MSNTLNKEITKEFFVDKENGYELLQTRWKELIKSGYKPTIEQILFYQVLRGKDWTKSFSPITNENKLNNGGVYESGSYLALTRIQSSFYLKNLSIFDGILSEEAVDLVRNLLPNHNTHNLAVGDYSIAYPGVKNALATR